MTGALGRTVREIRPAFGGGTLTNRYAYDAAGRLTNITASGRAPMLYEYDSLW